MSPNSFRSASAFKFIRSAAVCMSSLFVMTMGAAAYGQDYPNRTIRMIAPSAGSNSDLSARLIAQGLSGSLGQQVIVDNRSGSVTIPGELAAKATADGYTLIFIASSLWLLPFMQDNVPFDPVRDFAPITAAGSAPGILVVHPSLGVKSVRELIALAKAKPGSLNYANPTTGSTMHIAAEVLKTMASVNIVSVPYKGAAPALNALLGNEVPMLFALAGPVAPHLKSGRLLALAVSSAQPSALAPGIPTIAASGLPGFEVVLSQGMFAPAKTPAAIIQRLNQETARVMSRPDVKEKFLNAGTELFSSTPEEFAATIKSEMGLLGKAIKDAGIRAE